MFAFANWASGKARKLIRVVVFGGIDAAESTLYPASGHKIRPMAEVVLHSISLLRMSKP
jgi:hypothetical protein